MVLGVATWNMDHWKRLHFGGDKDHLAKAWTYALSIPADVLFVQEAVPPPVALQQRVDSSIPAMDRPDLWRIGTSRRWASAIVKTGTALEMAPVHLAPLADRAKGQMAISHPGSFVVAELTGPNLEPITLISAYGLMEDFNPEIGDSYATTTVNRMLSDLTPLLDSKKGRRVVLGGDLNISDQWRPGTRFARWGPAHNATLSRFASLGLTDALRLMVPAERGPLPGCPCGPTMDCRHVRTQRHGNNAAGLPWQNDYFFVGRDLLEMVRRCEPLGEEAAWALSDHCPVVIEIET
jgi:exonuclease III